MSLVLTITYDDSTTSKHKYASLEDAREKIISEYMTEIMALPRPLTTMKLLMMKNYSDQFYAIFAHRRVPAPHIFPSVFSAEPDIKRAVNKELLEDMIIDMYSSEQDVDAVITNTRTRHLSVVR